MVAQLVPQPHPILACADQLEATLMAVGNVQPLYMSPAEKTAAVVRLAGVAAALAELQLRVVASAEDAANLAGARDVGTWLAARTRADFPAGRADARLADALDKRWGRVAAAMAEGAVSVDQARVVVRALEVLPDDLDPDLLVKAEAQLVAWCQEFRPSELRRLGRRILEVVAPDVADAEEAKRLDAEEQRAREKCRLTLRAVGDGTTRISGVLPEAEAARLRTYLEAFTSPRRTTGVGGVALGEEDRIGYPRQLGQAFCALLEHLDPARLPAHGGDATTVIVTVTLDALREKLATAGILDADLTAGANLTATAARRLACTAQIIPAVLGGDGEVLDLGRTRRLFSPAQRKALRLRDQRCRAEGCTIPATWCEAHHRHPWSKGGKTDLADGVLLCSWHHHRAHDHRYTTDRLPTGDLRFHRRP